MDNRWNKVYNPQTIEQELGRSTIEWIGFDGEIHRVIVSKREYEVLELCDEQLGSSFVNYQLLNGLVRND